MMIALLLTIICSTSIALILKHNDTQKGDPFILLTTNYFVAAVFSFVLLIFDHKSTFSPQTFIFSLLLAAIFVFAFFVFTKSVNKAGAALATVSSRLSVFIPVLLSILLYHENPNYKHIIGFILVFITLILFYFSLKNDTIRGLKFSAFFYLIALFIGIGFNDFSMKFFNQWRPQSDKSFFLFFLFFFSFIYSGGVVLIRKINWELKTAVRGAILGIPNILSTVFLLIALRHLAAIVVYPVVNISVILLTTIIVSIFWRERVNQYGWWSIIFGMLSILFLYL